MINLSHEGFGRAIITVGNLIVMGQNPARRTPSVLSH